jgi:hypothetical protein
MSSKGSIILPTLTLNASQQKNGYCIQLTEVGCVCQQSQGHHVQMPAGTKERCWIPSLDGVRENLVQKTES